MQGTAMQGDDDAPMQDLELGSSVDPEKVERLLRKAETILAHRTDRLLLVLERPLMTDNYLGCLRTAECLGVHNVWIVVQQRGYHKTEAPAPGSKQVRMARCLGGTCGGNRAECRERRHW